MITCDFFGGLGNNLFQLATVYNIHKIKKFDLILPKVCDRVIPEFYNQPSKLEILDLIDNDFNFSDNINFNFNMYKHRDIMGNSDFSYTEVPINDNIKYQGYFQSPLYFKDTDIANEFILNKTITKNLMDKYGYLFNKNTLSLHYRLAGDRIEERIQHYHKTVSKEYYENSLKILQKENQNVLIFSDNINMAKDILGENDNFFFIDNNNDNIKDFILMSLCNDSIIGNSTFSWWSSFLNKNKNKKIICPRSEWYGPGYSNFTTKDLFPKTWIQL
jgi:hypothetical protein